MHELSFGSAEDCGFSGIEKRGFGVSTVGDSGIREAHFVCVSPCGYSSQSCAHINFFTTRTTCLSVVWNTLVSSCVSPSQRSCAPNNCFDSVRTTCLSVVRHTSMSCCFRSSQPCAHNCFDCCAHSVLELYGACTCACALRISCVGRPRMGCIAHRCWHACGLPLSQLFVGNNCALHLFCVFDLTHEHLVMGN